MSGRTRQNKLVHFPVADAAARRVRTQRSRSSTAAPHHLGGRARRGARRAGAQGAHPGGGRLIRAGIVVLGPTASGKSDVAMAVGARTRTTSRSSPSMRCRCTDGMDIGTAKPTPPTGARCRTTASTSSIRRETFTVADFQAAAPRRRSPRSPAAAPRAVLVAGTGLYLTAVIDDLDAAGGVARDPRRAGDAETDVAVAVRSPRRCSIRSPPRRIEPTNRRRIVRALEVCIGSGRPFSSFGPGTGAYPPIDTVQIGLRWPRDVLRRRIEQRVHAMIDAGLRRRGGSAAGGARRACRAPPGRRSATRS